MREKNYVGRCRSVHFPVKMKLRSLSPYISLIFIFCVEATLKLLCSWAQRVEKKEIILPFLSHEVLELLHNNIKNYTLIFLTKCNNFNLEKKFRVWLTIQNIKLTFLYEIVSAIPTLQTIYIFSMDFDLSILRDMTCR